MVLKRAVLAAGLLLAPMPAIAADANPAAQPVSRMATPWWRERFEAKRRELAASPPDVVLLGDSITQDWEKTGPEAWRDFRAAWRRFYGDRHVANLGFKGDSTAHLLWRMRNGELDGIAPRAAVVLIGANNFGHVHWDARLTLGGIDGVLSLLHARLPHTRIVLVGVLPSERSAWVTQQTASLDRDLPALAARYGAAYVDPMPVFAPGGRFDRGLFLDTMLVPPDPPLHPSAEGQAKLAEAIEPALAAALSR